MWNSYLIITEENDDISSPELPRQRKIFPHLEVSHNYHDVFVHTNTKDHYRQIYYEVLDEVTVGLADQFEAGSTATHLANVEKFLTCQQEDVSCIVSTYKGRYKRYTIDFAS